MIIELCSGESGIVICTNSYSGNFERAMAAYVFGAIDEYWNNRDDNTHVDEDEIKKAGDIFQDFVMTCHPNFFRSAQAVSIDDGLVSGVLVKTYRSYEEHIRYDPNAQFILTTIVDRAKKFCKLRGIEFKGAHWVTAPRDVICTKIG